MMPKQPPTTKIQPIRRRAVLITNSLLALGLLVYWAVFAPPPSSGGGWVDSPLARWVKGRIYAGIPAAEDRKYTRLTYETGTGWYGINREQIQSLQYYKALDPVRPTAERKVLVLQPIGPMNAQEQKLLGELREYCAIYFQLPARIAAPLPLPTDSKAYRPVQVRNISWQIGRGQYDAGYIIEHELIPHLPDDAVAYLGVTGADVYAGDMNYLFGLGSFRERAGVYSLTRYYPEFWNQKNTAKTRRLTLRRACQVLNHEAGHMLGLMHCVLYKCTMNGSNSLMDADATPIEPCPVCHRKLAWNLNWDESKRDRELAAFYRKYSLDGMQSHS